MSATKKLINSVETIVEDAVEGLLLTNSLLARVENVPSVVVRRDIASYKQAHVTILSGGGSGHEPAHAGFIGDGMLAGAILGNVFASPSVAQVLAALRVCAGSKGCLLVVKNYTGDRLNFGMAMERARGEGLRVEMVVVADDAALEEGKGITGGRGVAGTCFVHKVAGSVAADESSSLEDVSREARQCADAVRSLGVALTTCTVPGTPASDRLADAQTYEVGLGIHGEPGREQRKLGPRMAAAVAETMVSAIRARLSVDSSAARVPCALLLNNLGSLPLLEMLVVAGETVRALEAQGLQPVRAYVGTFMTSLEMAGVSLSVLPVTASLCAQLDAATTAPAWAQCVPLRLENGKVAAASVEYVDTDLAASATGGGTVAARLPVVVKAICARLVEIEPELTANDAICGDGDCGMTMKKGATAVQSQLAAYPMDSTVAFCNSLADSISGSMGGTSGALLELFFRAAANRLKEPAGATCSAALQAGCDSMLFYGGASLGMRTMLDALLPAVACLNDEAAGPAGADSHANLSRAAAAAAAGAAATASMGGSAGRANYVPTEIMRGTEDPGATAVANAFEAAAKAYEANGYSLN